MLLTRYTGAKAIRLWSSGMVLLSRGVLYHRKAAVGATRGRFLGRGRAYRCVVRGFEEGVCEKVCSRIRRTFRYLFWGGGMEIGTVDGEVCINIDGREWLEVPYS